MNEMDKIKILLIEDEDFDVRRVKNTVSFYEERIQIVDIVSNGLAALDLVKNNNDLYDVIIMDFQISGGLKGETLIAKIKEIEPLIQIIVITKMTINITNYEFANSLISAGAFWYCTKYPGNIEEYIYQPTDFCLSIFNAYEKKRLEKQKAKSDRRLNKSIDSILDTKKIIGESKPMIHLKELIERYAVSEANILINGASGTGKELVAWNIHLKSRRKYENFVPINCGSIPAELIESELFGYEKGSFTGASGNKAGLFENANNGTLFLDEVAELPLQAQVKLLRFLQEGEIEKIGRREKISINVRIIAATNKVLSDEVNKGRFREDLYYRLNVVPIDLVPLNKRGEDIILLFEHFLDYYSADLGFAKPIVEDEAKEILINYDWNGNVRELKNVVQRLVINYSDRITGKDLANPLILGAKALKKNENLSEIPFSGPIMPLKDMERIFRMKYFKYIRSISSSDSAAAEQLGLAPSNFYRMCKELGIK